MAIQPQTHGVELPEPPSDGITALRFAAHNDYVLASSWDGGVRLYDADRMQLRSRQSQQQAVLDCCFEDDSAAFSAGLEGTILRHDFFSQAAQQTGAHGGPVRCLEWLPERRLLVSGGWDCSLKLWDPRLGGGQSLIATVPLPGKVYTLGVALQRIVVGTSGRQVLIFDTRRLESGQPEQHRESSLKHQTRCIRCSPDGSGYALSSVEGRVAMEYFDQSEAAQSQKYAFKCHRRSENGADVVYPVNTMAFHLQYGTFATGGCDGIVNMWDGQNKKRLWQVAAPYPTSIAALAFNGSGSLLAIASSYTFEMGDRPHPQDAIFLRRMSDPEVQPKQRR